MEVPIHLMAKAKAVKTAAIRCHCTMYVTFRVLSTAVLTVNTIWDRGTTGLTGAPLEKPKALKGKVWAFPPQPIRGSGERSNLPERGSARKRFGYIFSVKETHD